MEEIISKLVSSWVYKTKTWARSHSGDSVRTAQALGRSHTAASGQHT